MKWMDLGQHGLRLSVGRMPGAQKPAARITGSATALSAHRDALGRLGFTCSPDARTWWKPGNALDRAMWSALRSEFEHSEVIDCEGTEVFDTGRHRQITYTKVGDHRGKKRLWLEGLRLADCGFEAGARYTVTLDLDARRVTLDVAPDGERQVSHRTRRKSGTTTTLPIIDFASDDLTDVIGEAGRVRATLYRGRIEFDLHPVDRAVIGREARARANIQQGFVTEGTLCAGGGVSTLALREGFEAAGLESEIEWIVDRERSYLQAAADNNPAIGADTRLYEAALEELDTQDLPPVDVAQVSLPCTGHSLSGKAKRGLVRAEDHPTDALAVFGLVRILDAVQPAVVISENVVAARDSATYHLLQAYLREQGYVIADRVLNDQDAGSLERRDRWWFVAISKGLADGFSLENLPPRARQHERLGDVLEAVADDDPMWARNDYLAKKAERDKAAGKGFSRQFVDADSAGVGTIGRGYAKRRSTEAFVQRADGMERLLTPIEHARVKQIPESLVQDLSLTLAHEILGQSILFHHATALAEHVGQHLRRVAGGLVPAVALEGDERATDTPINRHSPMLR